MSKDKTEHQSGRDIIKSRELSLGTRRPPAQIDGYTILKFLGSGSYGEVWAATDRKTGRRVAIKFFTRRGKSDVLLMAGEIEKLAVLAADRYVVQLFDVGWDAEPPYYVMDYIEHGSLEDRMQGNRPLSVGEATELFQEICNGMMHLHGKGILHCDLKPGNILLDQDGKPRVADFGQSRLQSDQTASLGTLFYMAPEQADLEAAPDARWDVYALGALIYSMLTGEPPYYCSESVAQIETASDMNHRLELYRKQLMNAAKPSGHRNVQGVDRALADIIDRCIVADPKKRFASVQSVLLALRQREVAKARLPLLVLGLLGPVLLMVVMSVFGWRAYNQALSDTDAAITAKAEQSNRFAAKLAATNASEKMDEYFRVVRQLANDEEFIELFEEVLADETLAELRTQLSDPNGNNEREAIRKRFIGNSTRQKLQPLLVKRLIDQSGDFPTAASWFINDRNGTQLASVFKETPKNTIGKNYSYRTYFTGEDRDLKITESDGTSRYNVANNEHQRKVIDRAHLSAIFLSDGTDTWKCAFSSPVVDSENRTLGIVALTVEVGDFIAFDDGDFQYAMLVDGREGDNTGVLLEHPLFDKFKASKRPIPQSLVRTVIDWDAIKDQQTFADPTSDQPEGERYEGKLLVAREMVTKAISGKLVDGKPVREPTGLYVLAVEDYDSILAPSHQMGASLGWLALWAVLLLLLVALTMWLMVLRMLRDSRHRLSRFFAPASESAAALEDMETIAMPEYSLKDQTLKRD